MHDHDKVVKSNSLINASYQMDLSEHRLMLCAIVKTRGTAKGFDKDNPVEISAKEYAEYFSLDASNVYDMMKAAQDKLKRRTFDYSELYKGKYTEHVSEPIFARSSYVDKLGLIRLAFSESIRPLITELEGKFTEYELMQIKGLTSQYAIRLYELLIQWRSVGKVNEIPLDEFRLKLGVGKTDYERFFDLEKRVITVAIDQVKTHTDITEIKMEKHKNGRVIRGVSFTFKAPFKKERNVTSGQSEGQTGDESKEMPKISDSQAFAFSRKIAKNVVDCVDGFSYLSDVLEAGKGEKDLAEKIESDLKAGKIEVYLQALKLSGFVDHSKKKKKTPKSNNQDDGQEAPSEQNSLFDIPDHVMINYIEFGGTITKEQFIEAAMAENVSAVGLVMKDKAKIMAERKK